MLSHQSQPARPLPSRPVDAPIRIEVERGELLILTWEGGTRSEIRASVLRAACLCADCRSEPGAMRKRQVLSRPEEVRIASAHIVGAYAVNLGFEPDMHRTGIFTFDQLQALGPPEPEG